MLEVSERREPSSCQHVSVGQAKRIAKKIPIVVFGVVLYFMYILTVGEKMFPEGHTIANINAQKISLVLFVWSSFSSQIVYFLLSSFEIGVLSSPISESFLTIRELNKKLSSTLSDAEVFPTAFACMFLASLATGGVFLAMYVFRAERFIKRIPSSFSNSLFVVLGILGIWYANERIKGMSVEMPTRYFTAGFNIAGFFLAALFMGLPQRCAFARKYSILLITFLGVGIFYLVAWVRGSSMDSLIQQGWFQTDPRMPIAFAFPSISKSNINYMAIYNNMGLILNIILVNILQFPINFGPTVHQTKVSASMHKELLVNGVANIVTSFLGSSSYLLPSSTIMVRKAGSVRKIDTALIGTVMALCFVFFYRFFLFIPFLIYDLLLLFIGATIVLTVSSEVVMNDPESIPYVIFVVLVTVLTKSIINGALAAGILQIVIKVAQKYKHRAVLSARYHIPPTISSSQVHD
ncbi:hypothetical protein NECID01_2020 [Nematocida sp. AWRm77]|nr:hypothetical protein NECID01_2020 [Nematocida sp. AWRm77]